MILMRFPGGKAKAVTLSYDDGVEEDIQLVDIIKRFGLKCTFNISSGLYGTEDSLNGRTYRRLKRSEAIALYKNSGMEVASHGFTHLCMGRLTPSVCTYELTQDRANLENDFVHPIKGFAYPFGNCNDNVIAALKHNDFLYARTAGETLRFDLPSNWFLWSGTCHHNHPQLQTLVNKFVSSQISGSPALFYLWGHSYEFEDNHNWHIIEDFAKTIGNHADTWYATNIEICEYIGAYNQLSFGIDGKYAYNPTSKALYFQRDGQTFCVQAGETIMIP